MKKKVFFIVFDNFIDVTFPVIKSLIKYFNIELYVISNRNNVTFFDKNEIEQLCLQYNIKYRYFKLKSRLRNPKTILQFYKIIYQVKRCGYDIVYFNGLGIPYLFFVALLLLRKKKFIFAIHDVISHKNADNLVVLNIYKHLIMSFSKNIHLFSKTQKEVFEKRYKRKNVLCTPLIIMNFGKSSLKPSKNCIRFLFFGAIRDNKGLEYLIQASNRLSRKNNKKFVVHIAGSAFGKWEKYEKLIEDKTYFDLDIRIIRNDNIPDIFSRSHFLVLPYKDVTQSGPLHIAMQYHLPVIVSNLKGFREYVTDNENGFFFKSSDISDLTKVMQKAMSLSEDEYMRMRKKQKEVYDKYLNPKIIINKYITYFQELINSFNSNNS